MEDSHAETHRPTKPLVLRAGDVLQGCLPAGDVSVLINVFALASSVYIMTVYDRVVPNNAIDPWALTAMIACVIIFDLIMKILRGPSSTAPARGSTRRFRRPVREDRPP